MAQAYGVKMLSIEKATAFVEKNLPGDRDRECYQCDTLLSKEETARRLADGGAKVQTLTRQTVTRRLFCSNVCWIDYLKGEGFLPVDDTDEDEL